MIKPDWSTRHLEPECLKKVPDIRKQIMQNAWADFERNRDPNVAYSGPHMVERDSSYFIEWKPVGFVRRD